MKCFVASIFLVLALISTEVSALDRCVDIGNGQYECAEDVLQVRQRVDGYTIDVGVTQRIDGTDEEKKAIRVVLQQMDDYFFAEVLSVATYEGVRHDCKNYNELCAFWTAVGECESNREFMLTNCAAACRLCLLLHSGLA